MAALHHDNREELTDWIKAIGRWKMRQRDLRSLVQEIEMILQEREELVEEALWMRAVAKTKDEHKEADQALSKAVAQAQSQHESTVRELEQIAQGLRESHVADLFKRPKAMIAREQGDRVEEAGRESFPASDPPSFNPGRT